MRVRREILTILVVVAMIGLAIWLAAALWTRPGEVPIWPLVGLGVAALAGLVLRLSTPPSRRPAGAEHPRPSQALEMPDWMADVQPPPEARPTLDVKPPRREESEPPFFPPSAPTRPLDRYVPPRAEPEPGAADAPDEQSRGVEDLSESSREVPCIKKEREASGPADSEAPERGEPEPEDEGAPPDAAVDSDDLSGPDTEPQAAPEEEAQSAAIQFSAYYPPEIKPEDWQPLRAYIYREPAYDAVLADARTQLGALDDIRETVAGALQPVPDDALVTAIPSVPGLEFDPPQASARFRKDWRRFDFEFRAVDAPLDESADGQITFFVEGVIVADVKLSVYVSQRAGRRLKPPQESSARPYQAVFCSYSHKDSVIVARVERSSRVHFTKFLRDVTTLRSGERWNDRLLELIDEADIFQLFWSKPAAESPYVAQEWQYALALRSVGAKGRYFIRPVRWEEPMPVPPPPELADLHFDLIRELVEEQNSE